MKRLLLLIAMCLVPLTGLAQSVSLTGTVTDTPDNQTWNGGTITFTFFGPQGGSYRWTGGTLNPNIPITATLSATGTYSVSVPDNSQITPTDSSWNIKVCPAVLPATSGCFLTNRVITAANTTLNFNPNSPRFSVPLTPQAITPVTAYADAEIVGGWVGFSYTNIALASPVQRMCSAASSTGCTTFIAVGGASSGGPAIYATAAKYNLPATGFFSCVAVYSNASTTLSTDATVDSAFTPAMAGWQIFLSNGPCQGQNGQATGTVHFNGTIASVTDAHHVVLSGTPSGTCTGSQGGGTSCRAYWVPSDSAVALNASWADATSFRGQCYTLVLPAGVYKFNTSIKSSGVCGTITNLFTGTAYNGPSVTGQNMSGTILVADPSFDASTCPNGCVFALTAGVTQSLSISNLTISGGGNATVTNGNGKSKIANPGWPGTIENVLLDYWGHGTSGFTGLNWNGTPQGQSYVKNVNVYNGGFNCFNTTAGNVTIDQLFCFTPAGSTISGSNTYIYGSQFNADQGICVSINSAATVFSSGNTYNCTASNNGAISTNGKLYLNDDTVISNTLTNMNLSNGGTAGQVFAINTKFSSTTGTDIGSGLAGSQFTDLGGNSFSGPNALTNIAWLADGHQVKAVCTGVATASSTLALISSGTSLTGTALTTACTGTTLDKGIPVNGARTLQNLFCTSSATTVSVACTVMTSHNGAAFASSGITCTMTAATSCNDGTHTLVVADGDFVTIQIVTGAAETGANIKAFVGWD